MPQPCLSQHALIAHVNTLLQADAFCAAAAYVAICCMPSTLQVLNNLGINTPNDQDAAIIQVVTKPDLKELLGEATTQRWTPASRLGLLNEIKRHLATLPVDSLEALVYLPAVGALRPANVFDGKPDPEDKLREFLALSFIMMRCLAANPGYRAQFLNIMGDFVAAPQSEQGDIFKTCRQRLYSSRHIHQYDALNELLGRAKLLGPVLGGQGKAVLKYVKCAAAVFVARLMVDGVVAA
jgi:hypothetical protein